ncbi:predicted membrane protein [Chthonomonas calidirosea]|uniref:Predicted membrane protein n=1 Tax=Chthonomonas calidirosea (strain DSM 23976 / ICMP 18418 / T49) TaxID=1303518 RepID=S0EZ94_CHTCT|nr:phage holin family protein [Chthonomonas calidirosea]CCW36079.1 Predicted membrane protein [Chthonomonas calidirosea T49]CEK17350.1 predicted membrane protein [Chthonomonas calidirosea]CEK17352.1 predicted membrane protein [Chthonomonas calidirosea]CEK18396.1 predicted membrane protein [Chthonomonas calidirosea]
MRNWITRWAVSALALYILVQFYPSIQIHAKGTEYVVTILLVSVILGLFNSLIRPIILFFAWPINCLTFGLFGFALNVACFWILGTVLPTFRITSPKAALFGFIAMGLISGLLNFFLKDRGERS